MERRQIYLVFITFSVVLAVIFSLLALTSNSAPTGSVVATTPAVPGTPAVEPVINPVQQQLSLIQQDLNNLRTTVTQTQQRLTTIEATVNSVQQEVATVSANLQTVQGQQEQFRQQVQGQQNQLSTGLAGLQQNVQTAKSELSQVDVTLEEKQQQTRTLIYTVLGFLVLAAIAGIVYYALETRGSNGKVNSEIVDYITTHIKQGLKYPQIRENLLKAGWDEEEIKWAYQETAKQNYQTYSKKKRPGSDQRKIMAISSVTLFLILGGILIMRGSFSSTGQAYHIYGGVEDYEETLPLNPALRRCYTPQILFNNACCDDLNNNTICDTTEGYTETAPATPASCVSNADCSGLRQCINNQCRFISELYNRGQCPSKCNIIRVYLTTYHGSGPARALENYTLRPGLGSYTGTGALAWTLLPVPDYCQIPTNQVTVPIKIERYSNSQLLGTEIIALEPGGEKVLNHPLVDLYNFTIRVNDLFHTCGASTFG